MKLNYRPIDADNHYYETLDAFTRYQDKAMKRRGVQVVQDGKKIHMLVGDKVNHFIPNHTYDPVIVPGCIDLFFRGKVPKGVDPKSLTKVEPIRPEYRDRDKRLEVMDQQGLSAALLFPTTGVGFEEALIHDPEATMAVLSAFNKWLEEDWGFNYKNRLISAAMLSLAVPETAEAEVDSLLKRGAKMFHIRPAPVPSAAGPRSLGHPAHDRVWAKIAEANTPIAFHLGDSGYNKICGLWGGKSVMEPFASQDALDGILVADRAIHDTMAAMITHGVFTRHPKLRAASIENGSEWVPTLARRLKKKANQNPKYFPEDPIDVLRRNVWVAPYYEESVSELANVIGVDRVLFGSDWPHGEGLADPVAFTAELEGFPEKDVRKIMHDNAIDLLGFAPAA